MVLVNSLFRVERAYRSTHQVPEPRRIHLTATSVYASWFKVSPSNRRCHSPARGMHEGGLKAANVREAGITTAMATMAMTFS
jgi:hypothetical protein